MLVPSRKAGPRAKHTADLPTIPYGTKIAGTAIGVGHCLSYRFYLQDVKRIAGIVHQDMKTHLDKKVAERQERKLKKIRVAKRELKIEYHKARLGTCRLDRRPLHEKRESSSFCCSCTILTSSAGIAHYEALDANGGYESSEMGGFSYEMRQIHHIKLCEELDCYRCDRMKVKWAKYGMDYKAEMYRDWDYWDDWDDWDDY